MTEFEQKVLEELADLRKMVESLKSDFTIAQVTYFENLPAAAVVGWIGSLTVTPVGQGPNPWLLPLRFQGNGTLLFLSKPLPGRTARA